LQRSEYHGLNMRSMVGRGSRNGGEETGMVGLFKYSTSSVCLTSIAGVL